MRLIQIPDITIEAYIAGCLSELKKTIESNRGNFTNFQQGYFAGIDAGVELIQQDEETSSAMDNIINGLKLKDPMFGMGEYVCPKNQKELSKKFGIEGYTYFIAYARGLADSIYAFTNIDTERTNQFVLSALQIMKLV